MKKAIEITVAPFECADSICFKIFCRFLISFFIYKYIALCLKQNIMHSAILDIYIYRHICVTSQPGKSFLCLEEFLVIFKIFHVVLLFSVST